jgi:hypothetical protein
MKMFRVAVVVTIADVKICQSVRPKSARICGRAREVRTGLGVRVPAEN